MMEIKSLLFLLHFSHSSHSSHGNHSSHGSHTDHASSQSLYTLGVTPWTGSAVNSTSKYTHARDQGNKVWSNRLGQIKDMSGTVTAGNSMASSDYNSLPFVRTGVNVTTGSSTQMASFKNYYAGSNNCTPLSRSYTLYTYSFDKSTASNATFPPLASVGSGTKLEGNFSNYITSISKYGTKEVSWTAHSNHNSHTSHSSHVSHSSHNSHASHASHASHVNHSSHGNHVNHSSHGNSASCCVIAGTKIMVTLDGKVRNIEDLKVGDTVISYNIEKGIFEEDIIVMKTEPLKYNCLKLKVGNDELTTTTTHSLYGKEGWSAYNPDEGLIYLEDNTPCEQLYIGQEVFTSEDNYKPITRMSASYNTAIHMYDITVKNNHCYFANNILIHNALFSNQLRALVFSACIVEGCANQETIC